MRIGGAKGLLSLISPDQARLYKGKEVVLRESMIKSIPAPRHADDPSLLTLDVLRCDSLRLGTVLSSEGIIAMVHGGVPFSTFLRMGEQSLDELRAAFLPHPLEEEHADDVVRRIVTSCYRRGGVGTERRKRQMSAEGKSTRVAGLSLSNLDGDAASDDDGTAAIASSERFDVDPVSGQSGSIAER